MVEVEELSHGVVHNFSTRGMCANDVSLKTIEGNNLIG